MSPLFPLYLYFLLEQFWYDLLVVSVVVFGGVIDVVGVSGVERIRVVCCRWGFVFVVLVLLVFFFVVLFVVELLVGVLTGVCVNWAFLW